MTAGPVLVGGDASDPWIAYVVIAVAVLAPVVVGLVWRAFDRRR